MKSKIILAAFLITATTLQAQTFEWAKAFGDSDYDEGLSITVDANGNVYATGSFKGTVDFDPGPGTFNLTAVGVSDVFIQKLDSSGNFVWAKAFGGSGSDIGYSIKVDAAGNIYTAGFFQNTVDFDPGSGTSNLTSAGDYDVFIQKLDAAGDLVWVKAFGGSNTDDGRSVAVDAAGNVYVSGSFQGTVDFDPGSGTFNLTSAGNSDAFILKLDAAGDFVWAKAFGGSAGGDFGNSLTVDASGNIYTTGYFKGTVDFDPGNGTFNLTATGGYDIFMHKLDASGNFAWAKAFGGNLDDYGNYIALDGSGNVYTTGRFIGTVDFDPGAGTFNITSAGAYDVFVQKLDASGNFVWAKTVGGSATDVGYSVAIDAGGNVYAAGPFRSTADFDPGSGTFNLTSTGDMEVFVLKLNASGDFVWAKAFGGSSAESCRAMTVDAAGNVYTTGYFQGTADFDPDAGTFNLTSTGNFDVFIQKMSQDLTTGMVQLTGGIRMNAFPNPTEGLVQLTFEKPLNDVEITLTDLQGKVIFNRHLDASVNEKIHIDRPAGVYLLSVKTAQGQTVVKLIKE